MKKKTDINQFRIPRKLKHYAKTGYYGKHYPSKNTKLSCYSFGSGTIGCENVGKYCIDAIDFF